MNKLLLDPDVNGDSGGVSSDELQHELTPGELMAQKTATDSGSGDDNTQAAAPDGNQDQDESTVGQALDAFDKMLKGGQSLPEGSLASTVTQGISRSRKFDGLDDEEKRMFTRMSNEAYARLYPQYLEHKKLKEDFETIKAENEKLKGQGIYEHENAFSITPEYQQLSDTVTRLGSEADFWQQQLALAKAGENWAPFIGYDDKGTARFGEPREGTPQAEAAIMACLTKAYTLQSQYSGQLESFKSQFSNQHKSFIGHLAETEKKIFQGADMVKLTKAAESKLNLFPAHIQRHPVTQSLAKALVVIDGLLAMIRTQKNSGNAKAVRNSIARAAGPVAGELSGAGQSGEGTVGNILKQMKEARAIGQA